jgi:hypothetical protein
LEGSDRLVGSAWRESVEQFHEARLVRITHGGFAIWFDPFGMLEMRLTFERQKNDMNVGMEKLPA